LSFDSATGKKSLIHKLIEIDRFILLITGKPAAQVITCESPAKPSLVPVRLMPTKWKAVDSSKSPNELFLF